MKKKSFRCLALFLICVFVFAGCGAKSEAAYDTAASADMAYVEETSAATESWVEEDAAIEDVAEMETGSTQAEEVKDTSRKLIKRYYLSLETKEYDALIAYIQELVDSSEGYIESSSLSGTSIEGNGSRYAYYVLRIPVSGAASFITNIEENAHVTYKSEEVEDVTLSYVDTESRIESLRIEQETLMEMLGQSGDLETILAIQSRLTEVRYQLESYESQLRSYDNLIEYTTISIDVNEVVRVTSTNDGSFAERLKDNFADGFYNFGRGVQNFIIWFAGAIPTFLFFGVIAAVAVLIVRKVKKGRRTRADFEKRLRSGEFDTGIVLKEENQDKKEE